MLLGSYAVLLGSPAALLGSPAVLLGSHALFLCSSTALMGSPAVLLGSPVILLGPPAPPGLTAVLLALLQLCCLLCSCSSTALLLLFCRSPAVLLGSPVVLLGSPAVLLGSPTVLLGSATILLGSAAVLFRLFRCASAALPLCFSALLLSSWALLPSSNLFWSAGVSCQSPSLYLGVRLTVFDETKTETIAAAFRSQRSTPETSSCNRAKF